MDKTSLIHLFCEEANEFIDSIKESLLLLEKDQEDMESLENCFVKFHALKGNAGFLGFKQLSQICSSCETFFFDTKEGKRELLITDVENLTIITNQVHSIIDYISKNEKESDVNSEEVLRKITN